MPYSDPEKQKEAQRKHYLANKDKVAERRNARKRALRAEVYAIKEASPCADCGVNYPYYVMQFDHTGTDKVLEVSKLMKCAGRDKIMAEIAKCELVCSNCHATRSWKRLNMTP